MANFTRGADRRGGPARTMDIHIGQVFGRWTVVSVRYVKQAMFVCECSCGTKKEIRASHVLAGESLSCGCLRSEIRVADLEGQRFGRFLVVRRAGTNKNGKAIWVCVCDCRKERIVIGSSLLNGNTTSCGCFRREVWHATKKHERTKEYNSWRMARQRCNNPNNPDYKDYGGRGIKVCDRWSGPNGYDHFLADMGVAPSELHSLDRYPNVNGDYAPDNCRWATPQEQARNKRKLWSGKVTIARFVDDPRKQQAYHSWASMKQRCANPNNSSYPRYGGRGIKVCARWASSFDDFFADMGSPSRAGLTLDRYPNRDGDYEPGNCRWATRKEQADNRNSTVMIEGNGRVLCLADWGRELGLVDCAIRYWLDRGKSMDEIIRMEHR